MRQPVTPEAYVDTGAVHSLKRDALACHRSQKNWLDLTQGTDSYLHALDAESKTLGKHSGAFIHAEGWSRHLHLGFGDATANPLKDALGKAFRFAPQPSV
jgi:LmbE family N-acetylglucosaminyl deacetylase